MSEAINNNLDVDEYLLEILKSEKFSLFDLHGELLTEWFENKSAGPLLLFVAAKVLDPNFAEEIALVFNNIDCFVYYIQTDDEENDYYVITLTHNTFYKVAVFGQEMTTEEFNMNLEAIKQFLEIDDTRDNS